MFGIFATNTEDVGWIKQPNQGNIFKGTIDIIYSEPPFVKLHADIIQNPLNFYQSNKEEDLSALSYIC